MAVRRVTTQLEGWWTSTNRGLWKKYTVGGLQLDGLLPSFFFSVVPDNLIRVQIAVRAN